MLLLRRCALKIIHIKNTTCTFFLTNKSAIEALKRSIMIRQIENVLKNKKQYETQNKIFYSNLNYLNNTLGCMKDAIKIDFQDQEKSIQEINFGIADSVQFKDFYNKFFVSDIKLLLSNISSYKNKWNRTYDSGGAIMKVYNSFNYTEDIKYEARLLELPMPDDFKLIIITPNEVDVLYNLFNKLTSKGLTAAIGSIQPLFTSNSELKAPSLKFSSKFDTIQRSPDKDYSLVTAELGNVQIDEHGVSIKVATYIFPSNTQPRERPSIEYDNLKKTFSSDLFLKTHQFLLVSM